MYILYNVFQDYDYSEVTNIAISNDIKVLETKRREIIDLSNQEKLQQEEWRFKQSEQSKNHQKMVKQFLEANKHALKKFKKPAKQPDFNGKVYGSGSGDYITSKWDFIKFEPSSEENVEYYSNEDTIDHAMRNWYMFRTKQGCDEYFDMSKMTQYLVLVDNLPPYTNIYGGYSEDSLKIEEVKEI